MSGSKTFSIRLTPEERSNLERRAGNLPLSAYVKSVLFDGDIKHPRSRSPSIEHKMLGHVLSKLGSSQIDPNLAALADDAKTGNLIEDEDTKLLIAGACADVRAMRKLLLGALGKRNLSPVAKAIGDATPPAPNDHSRTPNHLDTPEPSSLPQDGGLA
ncbi:MAG: hypothetical protein AAF441_17490 [Pseudomonadota bacterium]